MPEGGAKDSRRPPTPITSLASVPLAKKDKERMGNIAGGGRWRWRWEVPIEWNGPGKTTEDPESPFGTRWGYMSLPPKYVYHCIGCICAIAGALIL